MEQLEYLIEKYKLQISLILILMILISGSILLSRQNILTIVSQNVNGGLIRVDVAGAVKKPGVYQLKMNSIVLDAIKAAGGLTKQADLKKIAQEINQAAILIDGEKIYIPFKNENNKTPIANKVSNSSPSRLININTASLAELDSLPGIGPVYAQRIIDYRKTHGKFQSIEEIMNVRGIGQALFEKIQHLISV